VAVAGEVARFMLTNSEFQRFRRSMGSGILGWSPRGITSPRRIFSCCLYLAGGWMGGGCTSQVRPLPILRSLLLVVLALLLSVIQVTQAQC
jgi:hypothetical protein